MTPKLHDANGQELRVGDRVHCTFHEDDAEVVGFGRTPQGRISFVQLRVDGYGPWSSFVWASNRCDLQRIDGEAG